MIYSAKCKRAKHSEPAASSGDNRIDDMQDTQATQTEPKQPNYWPKTLAAVKMVNHGVEPEEALKLVNNTDKIDKAAVCRFKKKVNRLALDNPKIVKLAKTQAERILQGEPREIECKKITKDGQVIEYKDKIYPTDTNIASILSEVYSRYQPVKTISQSLNVNVDVSPVDLDKYANYAPNELSTGSKPDVSMQDDKVIDVNVL